MCKDGGKEGRKVLSKEDMFDIKDVTGEALHHLRMLTIQQLLKQLLTHTLLTHTLKQ